MAGEPDAATISGEISKEILQVHLDSYGTGASNLDVHVADDSVLVLIDVELARSERTLLAAGRAEAVKTMRESFQAAIGPTFTAIVERATGRRVSSFFSAMSMDPVYSIEVFRLHPKGSTTLLG